MRKKGTMIVLVLLLVFQNLLFGMVGFANEGDSIEIPDQDESVIEHPEEGESDTGLEDDESMVPEDEESTVTDEVYGPRSIQSGEAPVQLLSVKLFYLDENLENPVDLNDPDTKQRVSRGDNVKMEYEWILENADEYAGHSFDFFLPSVFKLFNDVEGDLVSETGSVGTFTISKENNLAVMTFNQFVDGHSNIRGTLEVWSIIREDLVSDTTEIEISFPVQGEGQSIPIKLKPDKGATIVKRGAADNGYNGTAINWEVDINTAFDEIERAVLTDEIPDRLELDRDSVEVYLLDVDLEGQPTHEDPVSGGYTDNSTVNKLEIMFGNIDSAYRVKFTTNVVDASWEGNHSFTNEAILIGDNINEQETSATVDIRRGETIKKGTTGYNESEQIISWEIKYNYNLNKIDNAVLTDIFGPSMTVPNELKMELIPESFKVYEVEIGSDGKEVDEGTPFNNFTKTIITTGEPDETEIGFRLEFNDPIVKAYRVEYQTRVVDPVYNNQPIYNTVYDGTKEDGDRRDLKQVILNKSRGAVDYDKKTVDWSIEFNGNSFNMYDVVLKDQFRNLGLQLDEGSVQITNLTNDEDFEVVIVSETGFEIKFLKPITDKHTLTYTTYFDIDNILNKDDRSFINWAEIEWKWNPDDEEKDSKNDQDVFDPNPFTKNNGLKFGSYNAVNKEITWYIGINYNRNSIENTVVEDILTEGQTLDRNSIEVREMVIPSTDSRPNPQVGDVIDENDYSITYIPSQSDHREDDGFRINLGAISKAYWITFKTSLDGQLIDKTYVNEATYRDEDGTKRELRGSLTVEHGTEYVQKEGDQRGLYIDWQVWINRGQSSVPAFAKIIDTPSENQILLENTFDIYETVVSTDGKVSKGENKLEQNVDYTLEFLIDGNGKETFEITFIEPFDKAYVLEYSSFINAKHNQFVNNTVKFEGEGIASDKIESTKPVRVQLSGGAGTGEGEVGKITVTKVDGDDHSNLLKGAVFSLYFKSNGKLIRTGTTNEEGKLEFDHLLFTEYILVEDEAPSGYVLNIDNEHEISLSKNNHPHEQLRIENFRIGSPNIQGKIGDYVWLDSNRNGIQDEPDENGINGVIVELYKERENGEYKKIDEQETIDKDGKSGYYLFNNLREGTYKVCFYLPDGYAFTAPFAGDDRDIDSNARPGEGPANGNQRIGCSGVIELEAGGEDLTIDAGLLLGRIGDYVWLDSNRNGIQDEPDLRGFDGVKVELYKKNDDKDDFEKIAETVTAKDENGKPGYYLFDNLFPGEYKVKFELPRGFAFTRKEVQNGKDGEISKAYYNGWTDVITLEAGEEDLTIDAGLVVLFGSGGDEDDGDNGGSNPPPTTSPGKEDPKGEDPDTENPSDKPGDGTDDGDGFPESPGAPGTGSGDTGNNGGTGTDGDDSDLANNPPVPGESDPKDKGRTLPQTGENVSFLPLIGLLLCTVAVILWFRRSPKLS